MQKKRFVLLGLTVVLAVGLVAGAFGVITRKAAAAVDPSARGPSVGVDAWGNQMVFWQGTDNRLWEAVHTAATNSWSSGALNLGNFSGDMGSEPSVAVANFGGFLVGSVRYGAQFVFWRGATDADTLWYTYWDDHGWHDAQEVPGVTNAAFTPSAAFNNKANEWGPGESQVSIWWEGTDGNLYYSRLENPLGGVDGLSGSPQWKGPHEATSNGQHLGPLGSAPGASNTSIAEAHGLTLKNGEGAVTWKGGTNSDLWAVPYTIDYISGDLVVGDLKKSPWTGVNGGPSATEEYSQPNGGVFDFVWQDNNNDLEYGFANGDLSSFIRTVHVGGNGALFSAPSIGYWRTEAGVVQLFVFFKGSDGNLHEAFFNQQDNNGFGGWTFYADPQFGQL